MNGGMGGRYSFVHFSAFLLGKYMGTLLVAISCDTDNALVPLAFALVERENKDS